MFDDLMVWRNGEIIKWKDATVHLLSHGFSRASAIFDVFGIYSTTKGPMAFRMDKHLERFFRSANLLGMRIGYSEKEIVNGISEVVRLNKMKSGLIKIMAYYSEEAIINLVLDSNLDVAIFGIPEELPSDFGKIDSISACFSSWRKIHPLTVPVEAKACSNYLNGMLARRDAVSRGFDIGILLTTEGYVAEGSIESVFMVKDSVLKVPKTGNILRSITRLSVIEIAKYDGIELIEKNITPVEFMEADELFASHSAIKVQPINKIESRVLEHCPGKVTKRIASVFTDILNLRNKSFQHWMQSI